MHKRNFSSALVLLVAFTCLGLSSFAGGQTAQDRITQSINMQQVVKLHDRLSVLDSATDLGPLNPNIEFDRMVLVLKPSAAQQQDLDTLLQSQQEKGSANYHQWLTPQQYGERFGVSQNDINKITAWLQAQGFHVDKVPNGRCWILFSGTSGQVEQTFHTQLHNYMVKGKHHIANASVTSIPQALSPVVGGILSLHNFFSKSDMTTIRKHPPNTILSNGSYALSPADFATIYDVNPVYKAGTTGAGQTIAIVGRSDIDPLDISDFRTMMGLPAAKFQTILNGPDPGVNGDSVEQTLDVTWSGAVAPGAMIDLVVSGLTATTDGVDLSAAYIVDNDLAPIMSTSYGQCEQVLVLNGVAYWQSIWEQAAAEGISAFVATGDNGGAGCDDPSTESVAQLGFAVNGLASTSYNVAVGGTEFNDAANPSQYWSAQNNPTDLSSALGYIPEMAWNETAPNADQPLGSIYAGSGGVSLLYSKPSWQTGKGVPLDGQRDLPDVSLTASSHDGYILCLRAYGGDCSQGYFFTVGGTSASSPSFAGIMALIDQQTNSIQGNPNPTIYALANSANAGLIFHDTTVGDNKVPAVDGSLIGYSTTPGYDLATGWGSVDVNHLLTAWEQVGSGKSAVALTSSATSITHGTPVTLSATVTPNASGAPVPTGDIGFLASASNINTSLGFGTLASGATQLQTNILPGGTQSVVAHYTGDLNYASMNSSPVTVTVTPEASIVTLFPAGVSLQYGVPMPLYVTVAGATSGLQTATGAVTFNDGAMKLGSAALIGGSVPAGMSNGSTIFIVPYLTVGSHNLTASYAGDASYTAGTSAQKAITVSQALSLLSLEANYLNPLVNTPVTLTAQVVLGNGGSPTAPITGAVQFFDGAMALGSAPLSIAPNAGGFYTARLPVTFTTMGAHLIHTMYNGDANVAGALPSILTINVGTHSVSRTSLVASATSVLAGSNVTFTAMVAGDSAAPALTGTVTFYDGSTRLGTGMVSAGAAIFSLTALTAGSHNITASYGGDTNFTASQSAVTQVQVNDFAVATLTNSATVLQGGSAQVPVMVTPNISITTPVTLSCSGLPSGASCSFTPAMVTPGSGPVQSVMLIGTTGPTLTPALRHTTAKLDGQNMTSRLGMQLGGALLLGIPILGFGFRCRRRVTQMFLGLVSIVVLLGMVSCGGGGSGSSTSKYTASGGTPAGQSPVTITAMDGTLSHTTMLALTVQSVVPSQ